GGHYIVAVGGDGAAEKRRPAGGGEPFVLDAYHLRRKRVVSDQAIGDRTVVAVEVGTKGPDRVPAMIVAHDQPVRMNSASGLNQNRRAGGRIVAAVLRDIAVHRVAEDSGRTAYGAVCFDRVGPLALLGTRIEKDVGTIVIAYIRVFVCVDRRAFLGRIVVNAKVVGTQIGLIDTCRP